MKPHPYLALAAHLEELSANRPASNQPWSSVAPLCLATLAVVPRATEKQWLRLEKAWLCMRCVLAFSALTCIRRWWGEACRCPARS